MKKKKSALGLPFLATVLLLIAVVILFFTSYIYVSDRIGSNEYQNPADDPDPDKKLDIAFSKELEILLGAIIFSIAAVFILIFLRHKRII
ncbi:hypothetical protein [Methanoplanus endosymbiosus]|uniref:Uncharacterized protein n=1 Tax=Methanoplanus endosymbiosus TaxID=33865 RepID=A0A9E7PMQ2_9EURY|nr:hypothetical protein [Methanoplanus endosymbiosus]UUX91779.1 hypothetical protein L6E24_10450 [Methanoplanus endosymbiosus]